MRAKKATAKGPRILGDPEEIGGSVAPVPRRDAADDAAEQQAEERRQRAFDAVPHWRGQKLEPFSVSRESLFLQLRTSAGAPGLYEAMRDGVAWFGDAIRMLWLCTHVPADWEELRATPLKLQGAIDAWADAELARVDRMELCIMTMRIWNQAQANAHVPVSGEPSGRTADAGN